MNIKINFNYIGNSYYQFKLSLTHLGRVTHICDSNLTSIGSVQRMACRLAGTKPLSKQILGYYQLDPQEQTSVKF